MSQFAPGTSSSPATEVELTISCRNLLDCDVFSKSDPMCVVSLKYPQVDTWKEICRTEVISNNLNPEFTKKAVLTYHFEVVQELMFSLYDVDSNQSDLSAHDYLGSCTTTLGQIVSAGTLTLQLKDVPNNRGQVIVKAEELSACRDEVLLQFKGSNLRRSGFIGWCCLMIHKLNPFLEFAKVSEDGAYSVVHRTEVISWSTNPKWKPFSISVRTLCGNDMNRDIRISCYDYYCGGEHTLLGTFHVTLDQLSRDVDNNKPFRCALPSTDVLGGHITLQKYEMRKVYSFLDYISNGTELNCTFAIDFTSSNGDPNQPDSLHYINNNIPNQYEQALRAVGDVIQDYDSDKMYPVLGFGARLPPDGRVSHEFYVNQHPTNPYCSGIDGVLHAYRQCIRSVQLYGPTNFSPVINHVARFANAYHDGSQYFILLIITDGVITDMMQTKKAIVEAARLPMSIIIVGVGYADFSAMDELDGDTVPLSYNGVTSIRDIVQFVPLKNFLSAPNPALARANLAKEVLAEIPDQIVGYMKLMNIQPGTKKA